MSVFLLHGATKGAPRTVLTVPPMDRRREIDVAGCRITVLRASDVPLPPDILHICGHVFAPRAILFGAEAIGRYPGREFDDWHGNFSVVALSENVISTHTDRNGADNIFYLKTGQDFLISNSWLAVAEAARTLRIPMSVYEKSLLPLQINLVIGRQIGSANTMIDQIKLLPSFRKINVALANGGFDFKVIDRGGRYLKDDARDGSLDDRLAHAVHVEVDRLASLLASDLDISLSLSGGMDSRALLGIALLTGKLHRLTFKSGTSAPKADDLAVAKLLADLFGFPLNASKSPELGRPLDPEQGYRLFRLANTGVYSLGVLPGRSDHSGSRRVLLSGMGGEFLRGVYRRSVRDFEPVLKKVFAWRPELGRGALQEIGDAVQDIGFDLDDPEGMDAHHYYYRSRIHGGRLFFKEIIDGNQVQPLTGPNFTSLASLVPIERRYENQLNCDLLMFANRLLAFVPFDKPSKGFSRDVFTRSSFLKEPSHPEPQISEVLAPTPRQHIGVTQRGNQQEMNRLFWNDFASALEVLRDSKLSHLYSQPYLRAAQLEASGRVQDAWRASSVIFAAEAARFSGS